MLFAETGFIIALLLIAIFLVAVGGYLDVTGREKWGRVSKYHFWADGTFLLVLSGWLLLARHSGVVRAS